MLNKIKIAALASLIGFSSIASADVQTLEQVKQDFDKPYIEFVKVWMKTSSVNKALNFISMGIGAKPITVDGKYEVSRTYDYPTKSASDDAVTTFTAYCNSKSGIVEKIRNEVFCLKDGNAFTHMAWELGTEGVSSPHPVITFVHNVDGIARNKYNQLTQLKTGDSIKTKYGEGLVIERKDGNVIYFQPAKGPARWITTDDIAHD